MSTDASLPLPDLPIGSSTSVQHDRDDGAGDMNTRTAPAATRRNWTIAAGVALVAVVVVVIVIVVANTRPSFQSVADECGGPNAGVLTSSDGLVINPLTSTVQTLVCVTGKLLPNQTDQYTVSEAVDAGATVQLHLDGYTINVVPVGGARPAVSFTR